jgi:hypothetical protein
LTFKTVSNPSLKRSDNGRPPGHQALGLRPILRLLSSASHRWCQLSSNVRRQMGSSITFGALLVSAGTALAQPQFPEGWRAPFDSELRDEARNNSPSRYTRAEGDFNRDGITDRAYILKKSEGGAEGIWVQISAKHGGARWVRLDPEGPGSPAGPNQVAMAVETVPPRVVPYLCFDTATKCDVVPPEQRREIRLRDDSLLYFRPESAASLYFWSFKHKRFLRVWVSD